MSDAIGKVRYVGWTDREPPSPDDDDDGGNGMMTSRDSRTNHRKKRVTGVSGHSYKFRGQLGRTSQWLPIRSYDDLQAFDEHEEYETTRP